MKAHEILGAAAKHLKDRATTYDKPEGERSMAATVEAFKAITGVMMTEEQGWLFMQTLKAVRSQQGAYRADSYEDGAAYAALAGEAAARERQSDRHAMTPGYIEYPDAQEEDDWIPWGGGECPVPGRRVSVKYRAGMTYQEAIAGTGYLMDWAHEGHTHDIIAYRVLD